VGLLIQEVHNEKLNVKTNIVSEIENLREQLYKAIDSGNYSKALVTSQELDLVIYKFIITEINLKKHQDRKCITFDVKIYKERSFENV
jgi:ArsR family metal-binding transcriptional regulator